MRQMHPTQAHASGQHPGMRFAVACPHPFATAVAGETLRDGGNAIDATVVCPQSTSLGGDLMALVRKPDGKIVSINASGPASLHVDIARQRSRHGVTMPTMGADTVTVPGAVGGLAALHELGAALPWARDLDGARGLGEEGALIGPGLGAALAENHAVVLHDPGLRGTFAPTGHPLQTGERLSTPALCRTLCLLAEEGPSAFYRGEIGRGLGSFLSDLGSPLEAADFDQYHPTLEAPLGGHFAAKDVWTNGPSSQGLVLLEILGALEAADCGDPLGRNSGVLTELFCLGLGDRDRFLADPAAMTVAVSDLLDQERLTSLGRSASLGEVAAEPTAFRGSEKPESDGVAVVCADSSGRAVSLIQSLGWPFGAGLLHPGTGIILHNHGASFSLGRKLPNGLAPGRRPAHYLMPVMATTPHGLELVLGTTGGRAQPQIHAQLLIRLLAGVPPDEAVSAPRFIVDGLDDGRGQVIAFAEDSLNAAALGGIGGRVPISRLPDGDRSVGHAQIVKLNPEGSLTAASDPRSGGTSITTKRP
jgi:gamma-glutamyltranspeptidase